MRSKQEIFRIVLTRQRQESKSISATKTSSLLSLGTDCSSFCRCCFEAFRFFSSDLLLVISNYIFTCTADRVTTKLASCMFDKKNRRKRNESERVKLLSVASLAEEELEMRILCYFSQFWVFGGSRLFLKIRQVLSLIFLPHFVQNFPGFHLIRFIPVAVWENLLKLKISGIPVEHKKNLTKRHIPELHRNLFPNCRRLPTI